MANTMEQQSSFVEPDFNLKEWALKARVVSREKTSSRRFSASNLKSFREEARSFRSSMTISSTASSPGYTLREEIDPSTYSFTTALKALQARAHVYTWEYLSPDGSYTLSSKWNDAEKYISNPLSGEVPLECLSKKTLSARSFRGLTSRITMSAPLIYPSQNHQFHAKSPINEHQNEVEVTPQEKKTSTSMKRDVGTQSTSMELNSSSPSPARTPSIEESSIKASEVEGGDNSSISTGNLKSDEEVEAKETRENLYIKRDGGGEREQKQKQKQKQDMTCRCRCSIGQRGCLSLRALWMTTVLRHRDKHKFKNQQ